jgi:hypothetical protein
MFLNFELWPIDDDESVAVEIEFPDWPTQEQINVAMARQRRELFTRRQLRGNTICGRVVEGSKGWDGELCYYHMTPRFRVSDSGRVESC